MARRWIDDPEAKRLIDFFDGKLFLAEQIGYYEFDKEILDRSELKELIDNAGLRMSYPADQTLLIRHICNFGREVEDLILVDRDERIASWKREIIDQLDEDQELIVVGENDQSDEWFARFLVLRDGHLYRYAVVKKVEDEDAPTAPAGTAKKKRTRRPMIPTAPFSLKLSEVEEVAFLRLAAIIGVLDPQGKSKTFRALVDRALSNPVQALSEKRSDQLFEKCARTFQGGRTSTITIAFRLSIEQINQINDRAADCGLAAGPYVKRRLYRLLHQNQRSVLSVSA